MSGGSLNYIYCRDIDDLFSYDSIMDLEGAVDILQQYNYIDVEKDVRRLIEYIKCARNRVEVLHKLLGPVLKGAEWCDCCDIGPEDLAKIIEKYRTGGES